MPRRDPWTYIGLVAFLALLFVALFGERIAPHEAIYFVPEHGRDPRPYDPGLVFPFGSDVLGRDLISVVLAGARTTLAVVLLGGLARVALGLVAAGAAALWSPVRLAVDAISEITAAVPATLVVLLVVLVFVRGDTTPLVFVGALLITGWAGPYRVMRLELDRLARAQFTDAAASVGLRPARILVRHHLPHLIPSLAVNASQQVVASLVALAELGVLGVFVGSVRSINIEESLSLVTASQTNRASISDPPEWGGLLANARTTENLWTTRWVFLVPGIAFALTAVAIAVVGVALARRYARRDVFVDIRSRGARALALGVIAIVLAAAVMPEPYAEARSWASDARASLGRQGDLEGAFGAAGLAQVGGPYAVARDVTVLREAAPATVRVNDAAVTERGAGPIDVLALLYSASGGGHVDAPLVFASWGISPADYPPRAASVFAAPDFGTAVADWPDDYAGLDLRGKVVVVLRPFGIATGSRPITGPDPESSVANALKRGAAAVILVDPSLSTLPRVPTNARANIYDRLAKEFPLRRASGPPVVVLSLAAADRLLAPAGLVPSQVYASLDSMYIPSASGYAKRSRARPLGVNAVVDVAVESASAHPVSLIAQVPTAAEGAGRIVIWGVLRGSDRNSADVRDVLAALARELAPRGSPFVFVAFDPSVDEAGNAAQLRDRLAGQRIALLVVLDGIRGTALRFTTPMGQYIPALDLYADRAGARHEVTRSTVLLGDNSSYVWPGIRAFADAPSVIVNGVGPDGDLRADAAATFAYLAARMALGAEEAPR